MRTEGGAGQEVGEGVSSALRVVARAVVAARAQAEMPGWFVGMARSVLSEAGDSGEGARRVGEWLGTLEGDDAPERARALRTLRQWAVRVMEEPAPERAEAPVEVKAEVEAAPTGGLRPDMALGELPVDDEIVDRLEPLGVTTAYDLLAWAPAEEHIWAPVHGAGRALPPGRVAVGGRARLRTSVCTPGGEVRSSVLLYGAGPLRVHWEGRFGAADLLRMPHDGKVTVLGEVEERETGTVLVGGRLISAVQGHGFELRWHADPAANAAHAEALAVLEGEAATVEDLLPEPWPARSRLPSLAEAFAAARVRGRAAEAERRRLALDELVLLQIGQAMPRHQAGLERGIAHGISHREATDLERMGAERPLTDPQQSALEDIKRDLRATTPMHRLLAGPSDAAVEDVALRAVLLALEARAQVLVVCHEPQTALVRHTLWETRLRRLGYASLLLSGEARRADHEALRKAEYHVVFGTPAVFEQALEWRRLGLVVLLEQAGYGALLAQAMALRAPRPDLLVVCRTPLHWPRYFDAMGGLDLSWVAAGAAAVPAAGTVWSEAEREGAYARLGEAARAGRPVVLGFPLTRAGTDLLDLRESGALLATLRKEVFPGVEIGLFHGAHPADERRAVLNAFYQRRVRVLVATTTLEIAEAHPAGAVVMLEHSDRMDVQRLMRWRAFAGPEGEVHYVIGQEPRPWGARAVGMLAERWPDVQVVAGVPEAFPRELVGAEAPPGPPVPGWVSPDKDLDLLVLSRRIAHAILAADPSLRAPEHARLARVAHARWARWSPENNPIPAPRLAAPRKRRRRKKGTSKATVSPA
jgi:ATP-dependent DNA helicase RecG